MTEKAASIEVRNVSKRFGVVTALDKVSFDVRRRVVLSARAFGCGKTTMLRILAGLEEPDSGMILFNGKDISSLPPHRRGAPMVFQTMLCGRTSRSMTTWRSSGRTQSSESEAATRTQEALHRVGLDGLGERMRGSCPAASSKGCAGQGIGSESGSSASG